MAPSRVHDFWGRVPSLNPNWHDDLFERMKNQNNLIDQIYQSRGKHEIFLGKHPRKNLSDKTIKREKEPENLNKGPSIHNVGD